MVKDINTFVSQSKIFSSDYNEEYLTLKNEYREFYTEILKEQLDATSQSIEETHIKDLLKLRSVILWHKGYNCIQDKRRWDKVARDCKNRWELIYSVDQIKAFYLKFFYLFDAWKTINLHKSDYYLVRNFKCKHIKSIFRFDLKKERLNDDQFFERIMKSNLALKFVRISSKFEFSFKKLNIDFFINDKTTEKVLIQR